MLVLGHRVFLFDIEILSSLMRREFPGPRIRTHEMDQNQCPAKPNGATVTAHMLKGEIDACG